MLSSRFKSRIKHIAKMVGLLDFVNQVEYLYGNRISARALSFYRQFIPQGSLCFDVGSHYGLKAELFRKLGAKVIAVEPNPDCCSYLRRRFGENSTQVIVVEKGCGETNGRAELHIFELNPQNSTVRTDHARSHTSVHEKTYAHPIDIVTMDSLIGEFGSPAFCKIDSEGFELAILKGLTKAIPALSFEFHCNNLAALEACLAHLLTLDGYVWNYCIEGKLRLHSDQNLNKAELLRQLSKFPSSVSGDIYGIQSSPR